MILDSHRFFASMIIDVIIDSAIPLFFKLFRAKRADFAVGIDFSTCGEEIKTEIFNSGYV
ncbi:hypothetical protein KDAU_46880 [Dictyobacter aurantiacus]|uniref:Uncharacterized protein n=1 Tax=Dictyobacter aurantiacus TaxID=1936993 RepID=A0A401ZKI0_9CHLR|nr:hypothetical protein KDAU_46880 [Dictyobacter aurantiacus]